MKEHYENIFISDKINVTILCYMTEFFLVMYIFRIIKPILHIILK